jgi:hypothetical protein
MAGADVITKAGIWLEPDTVLAAALLIGHPWAAVWNTGGCWMPLGNGIWCTTAYAFIWTQYWLNVKQ